jgi:signal transduction histidine kinase/ActR/RegA family two-component response regulator
MDYDKQLEKSYRFIHPEDLAMYKEHTRLDSMIKIMEEHDGVNVCTYRYQLYKEMKWARVKCVYLPRKKNKILVLTKDISKEHVQEINAKNMLEKALKDANQAVQAKQDFLSNMSHEIRTPLSGIKGMLSFLLDQPEYKDNSYLKKAFISTKHLSGLLNDILDMAKIDSGTIEIHKEFMLMNQLVQYIDAIIRPMAQEKNISFEYHHNYSYDGIYIDAGRLNQIMINLLSNAVKYTKESGNVTFEIRAEQIKDHLLRVFYVIEDNGVGMSEEFLKIAFLAFEQENHNYGVMGTGLGLTITKRLVELMGGKIDIQSELGVGTKVTVVIDSFAANLAELPEEARNALQQVEPEEHKFRGKRALVVEDNDINMEIVVLSLEALEIEVEKAYNGKEAVSLFENSTPYYYDVIFMDIMMPVMDGLKATQLIRSLDREDSKNIGIVAMTANAFLEDVNKSLESGMNYHLIKPFDKTKLLRILFKVMK